MRKRDGHIDVFEKVEVGISPPNNFTIAIPSHSSAIASTHPLCSPSFRCNRHWL
jgi:hypothetical protein